LFARSFTILAHRCSVNSQASFGHNECNDPEINVCGSCEGCISSENAPVKKGQLLIDIQSPVLNEKNTVSAKQSSRGNLYCKDVVQLILCESFETKPMARK